MHTHAQLISKFYAAFQERDAETMAACYHPEVHFSDPVFPSLKGAEAGDMWRMLCERGADLQIDFRDVAADDASGRAHWDARYTFSATGRKVLNKVDAEFEFKDGKIIRHRDHFSFTQWAGQALGLTGRLLGWTPLVKNKVRRTAAKGLEVFRARRGAK